MVSLSGEALADNLYRVDNLVEKPKQEDAPSQLAVLGRLYFDTRYL